MAARPVVAEPATGMAPLAPTAGLPWNPLESGAVATDIFAATTWQVAPAPAPAPSGVAAAPQKPAMPSPSTAPPPPFRYIGLYGDIESQLVMLVKGDRLFRVAVGDTVENVYRVERVTGSTVELMYLPLKISQPLTLGGTAKE